MRIKGESQLYLFAALGLAALVLIVLGDLLVLPGDQVFSSDRGDVAYYFAHIRAFTFAELASGNLPLWNPHLFSGTPLLGSFQAGVLYPPNLIYLLLPLAKAINLDAALHVFLTGFFTFAWVRGRGVHFAGAFFAGTLAMFSGACALRVMAGQLSVLAGNAWMPLVLLAVDRLLERPSLGWCLAGIAAVTLQVLAGYPFCVFATAIVVGASVLLRLPGCADRKRAVVALAALAVAPVLLSAVQLLTGLHTSAESARAGGVTFLFASAHSIPLENLITTLVPGFYGDLLHVYYWGRWWIWDVSIFLGAPALVLAALGIHYGRREQVCFASVLMLGLFVLALGSETPVYEFLFDHVPGFDLFRAPSKFAFAASLFVAMLAGIGLDHLWRDPRGARVAALASGLVAAALVALALWIRHQAFGMPDGGAWSAYVLRIGTAWVHTPEFVVETANFAIHGLWRAVAVCVALGVALALRPGRRWMVTAIVVLGVLDLLGFARAYRAGFSLSELERPDLAALIREHPGDDRIFVKPKDTWAHENQVLEDGALSIWGYDPVQLGRYVQLIWALRTTKPGKAPSRPLQFDGPQKYHPVFRLLRCRYALMHDGLEEHGGGLPRFALLHHYRVLASDAELPVLIDPDFDPHRTVLLEVEPDPPPAADGGSGRVTLTGESTDHLDLEVETETPAILLISDAYSTGWRARPLAPGPQSHYEVLPADHVLRAIPLAAGSHRLRVEYAPAAYRVGLWISIVSSVAFFAVVGVWLRRRLGASR